MPYINVKLAGSLNKEQKAEIAKEITDTMSQNYMVLIYHQKINLI